VPIKEIEAIAWVVPTQRTFSTAGGWSMGRMRLRRKPGVLANSGIESLESRRLMAANYGGVHVRELPVGNAIELVILGSRRGDEIQVEDNGTANPGNITVTMGNGASYTSKRAIAQVVIQGRGGNDHVQYDLVGDLISPRVVLASMGQGEDHFTANIRGNVNTTGALDLEGYGDGGNDTLTINQTGAIHSGVVFPFLEGDGGNDILAFHGTGNLGPDGNLGPALSGGNCYDAITVYYTGVIQGKYQHNLTIDGGNGRDVLSNTVNALRGSTGVIGYDAATKSVVQGGTGNDMITYAVNVDPADTGLQVFGLATGGRGIDMVQRTKNVQGDDTNENDSFLV
jgi:hypothetical protein